MAEQPARSITRWLTEIRDPQKAEHAWDQIIRRLYPISYTRSRRHNLQSADVSSTGQRAVVALFRRLQAGQVTVTNRGQLFGLLSMIAKCEVADRIDRNQRLKLRGSFFGDEDDSGDDTLPRWLEDAEPTLEEEEEANLVERRFLSALDDDQLKVYQLRTEEDLDAAQTATRLGWSAETVYRRLREMRDVLRTVGGESEIGWLRENRESTDARSVLPECEGFLDDKGREALTRWISGENGPVIAGALRTTEKRTYALLSHIDDVLYVLRRRARMDDLRVQTAASGDPVLLNDLKEIIKKRKWPIFEAWLSGAGPERLVADSTQSPTEVFAALRAIHESARAIRRVL